MEFHILMEKYLDKDLKSDVEKLLDLKMNSPKIAIGKRFNCVNEYIDNEIAEIDAIVASLSGDKVESWNEYMSLAEAAIFEYAFKLGMQIAIETLTE